MTAGLDGVRVLVVEDEYLVAVLIQEILETAGCVVSGPIPRLPEALDAVDHDDYDAAVLDVNLAGERVDPVAQALSRRNVPFVFVTGMARACCRGSSPSGHAFASRSGWPSCSVRCRIL